MEVKPGYKQTEVGVIPEAWQAEPCGNLCTKIQDGTHFSPTIRGNDYLYLTSKNVRFGFLDVSTADRIDAAQHAAIYKRCDVKYGDVLLTKDGANTGNAALNTLTEQFSLLSSVAFLRFDPKQHSAAYFLQQCLSAEGQQRMKDAMSGNAITRLTLEKIRKLRFPVAPLTEQRAIAEALSDVDALLGGLDQLIAKKRDLKQAAMQQLLTGQTRLPGFHGEWEVKRLGDVAHIKTGSRNNEEKVEDGQYPFFVRSEFVERINSYSHDCEAILVPGEGRIGDTFHYIRGRFDVHQRVYAITKFSPEISGKFLYFYLSESFGAWAMQNTVKATVDSLRLPTFQTFEMCLPPTEAEQIAIASVLTEMDAELAALEQRREKTRALKQAMMQELLTGRTRFV
jgi:type I restriction enzyme S subunit